MNDTLALFSTEDIDRIPLPDADVQFRPAYYGRAQSEDLMQRLLAETCWKQETIRLWGKQHLQPRLSAWYGDADTMYAYSGVVLNPHPWTDTLLKIKRDIEEASTHRFNSVLLNLYRDGNDSVGWHSDAEPELGSMPVIASLSLGETRVFRFRHKLRKELKPVSLELTDGSLLFMASPTQRFWQHTIVKEAGRKCGPRINLTFRTILRA